MKHPILLRFATLTLLCVPLLLSQAATAQILHDGVVQRQVRLLLKPRQHDTLRYFEVRDSTALLWVARNLRPENYPVSVVKKPVIDPFFDLIQHYESQLDNYRILDRGNITLDSIQQLKIAQLERLNDIQVQRVANYKQLSDDMIASNALLNDQLNHALALAKDCNRGKVTKRLWAAAVGAGVGFTLAGLIAFLK